MTAPKDNPKHIRAQKDGKSQLEYLPVSMWPMDAAVHKTGGVKYGLRNWRLDSILASTYVGAMLRHLSAWIEGEDIDPESGYPHLTHLRACCAVVLDGNAYGKLVDDRLLCESKDPADGAVTSAHVRKPSSGPTAAAILALADTMPTPSTNFEYDPAKGPPPLAGYPGSPRYADGTPAPLQHDGG